MVNFEKGSGTVRSHADHPYRSIQRASFSGELILLCVRWYLRYPLAYEHFFELLLERGVAVDASLHLALGANYAPELISAVGPT